MSFSYNVFKRLVPMGVKRCHCVGMGLFILQQLVHLSGKCTFPCFPGNLLPILSTIFIQSHCLLSHITTIQAMNSIERGINPAKMTIINPGKKCWPSWGSNKRLLVLKSNTSTTELHGLGCLLMICLRSYIEIGSLVIKI